MAFNIFVLICLELDRRDRKERIVKGGEEWRWVSHVMADVDTSSKKTVDVYTERYDVCADIAEHPDMKALVCIRHTNVYKNKPVLINDTT